MAGSSVTGFLTALMVAPHVMASLTVYDALGFIVAVILLSLYLMKRQSTLPLPPGPRALPIVGNLFDMPAIRPWVQYTRWAEQYNSDVVYLQVVSQPLVILNSATAAFELLEKRASVYSDKPLTVMQQLVGWTWNIALMPYGPRWRSIRRVFHQQFNAGALHKYRHVQEREVAAYLRRELAAPEASVRSINHLFSAIILDIVYGTHIKSADDPAVTTVQEAVASFGDINVIGAFWVDSFPILRHLPAWIPGLTFHGYVAKYAPRVRAMRDGTVDIVKREVAQGIVKPSIAHTLLREIKEQHGGSSTYEEEECQAVDAVSVSYVASVETSQSSTSWFIIAMALFPQVQHAAQREIDLALGTKISRLPTHDDIDSLPYLQAVYLETLRWRPALPVGLPHRCMIEDEYRGRRIPNGALVVPNTWKMCHDPQDYPDPENFNPDRFLKNGILDSSVLDPTTMIFGFGRRICAGRHFAKDALLLTFASILSVFNIEPALDAEGCPRKIQTDIPAGALLYVFSSS
ncbi:hypothetical protein NM688_g1727 [Phlebia brevispora]|uniref:Uncharacterized protein n=1 Tax=Phlebia brevispora TaxID=194682 RepID=A0ACC1TAX0_9APHY|nr:hypothetical protein NM688_g1727 [Phlebia brevispora]